MIGQPMDASGFGTLKSHFPDRTVVTYDPRGLGRSVRKDGRVENEPSSRRRTCMPLIEALGAGPVEMFASSGGAVTALALVDRPSRGRAHARGPRAADHPGAARRRGGRARASRLPRRLPGERAGRRHGRLHRDDVVAGRVHRRVLRAARAGPRDVRHAERDDGSRDDPLLSDRSWPISSYRPDAGALTAAPTRIVIAVGEESARTYTGRTSVATAELLGQEATVFPSHHGGFLGGEYGYAGQPEAFAHRLREVLDDGR